MKQESRIKDEKLRTRIRIKDQELRIKYQGSTIKDKDKGSIIGIGNQD